MLSAEQRAHLASLEGLISEAVGLCLAEHAAAVAAERAIVEIGSYCGKSTCYLAAGARAGHGAPVFAIDPWDSRGNPGGRFGFDQIATRRRFQEQVDASGLAAQITPLRAFASRDIAPHWLRPVGLLYIDGSHTEADVRADWNAWRGHLAAGAIVAFDDYRTARNPGVAAVVDRIPGVRVELGPTPLALVRWPAGA